MISTYVLIFISAYQRRRTTAQKNETYSSARGRSVHVKDLKNAKTLATFVLAFSVCWGTMFLAFVSTDVSDLICAKMLLFVF